MTHIHDHETDHETDHVAEHRDDVEVVETDRAYEKFGGVNLGAALSGWLVAIGVAVLLTGIVGAVAAAIGDAKNITQSDAEREAGTVGVASAFVLLAVLVVGYYAGGYVAGRMSRFDGGRQGLAVGASVWSSPWSPSRWAGSSARRTTCWTASTCRASRSRTTS